MTLDFQEWSNRQMIESYEAMASSMVFACETAQVEETALRGRLFSQEYLPQLYTLKRQERLEGAVGTCDKGMAWHPID